MSYIVICRVDKGPDGKSGSYVGATRTIFTDAEEAAKYASAISPSREPRIVSPAEYLKEVENWRVT